MRMHCKIFILITLFLLLLSAGKGFAQEPAPKPISVATFQNLNFGAFFQGTLGGSVIIYPDGSRTTTGDIVPANLGFLYFPAIFEVTANPGTLISITKGPDAVLSGSNGGSLVLTIGSTSPASPFVNSTSPPGKTQVRVGGTLIVGNPIANPQGSYNGTFYLTFNQE